MLSPLLIRGLIASTLALTLGHAATVAERDCTPVNHTGWLMLYHAVNGGPLQYETLVNSPSPGEKFAPVNPQYTNIGRFSFNGCPGNSKFNLICTDCSASGSDTAATKSDGDVSDRWYFYNAAEGTASAGWTSFTWDGTYIWPVIYTWTLSGQPVQEPGPFYVTKDSSGSLVFVNSTSGLPSDYYALAWWETTD